MRVIAKRNFQSGEAGAAARAGRAPVRRHLVWPAIREMQPSCCGGEWMEWDGLKSDYFAAGSPK